MLSFQLRVVMFLIASVLLTACGGGNSGTNTGGGSVTAPSVVTALVDQSVIEGNSAKFSVIANGSQPLTYQWSLNGSVIPNVTSSELTLPKVAFADNNNSYTVKISNSAGSVTSSATLSVTAALPQIVTQPVSLGATVGDMVKLSVIATSSVPMTYQWYKDSNAISSTDNNTAMNADLVISAAALTDSGNYLVKISNLSGSIDSSVATLTVSVKPVPVTITTQPTDQFALPNATATFSVVAAGYPSPSYQWQKSTDYGATWANVSTNGNLASYTTPTVSINDNGTLFQVIVSNTTNSILNTVTSTSATLSVIPPPSLSYHLFQGFDNVNGFEPWVTDGDTSGNGTYVLTYNKSDIFQDPSASSPSLNYSGGPYAFTEIGTQTYFIEATSPTTLPQIWKFDGSNLSQASSRNPVPGSNPIGSMNGSLYFISSDTNGVPQLWRTDSAGDVQLTNISSTNTLWVPSNDHVVFNNFYYFAGDDGTHGRELWRTDGNANSGNMWADINTVAGASSNPSNYFIFKNEMYFQATDTATQALALFKTDGVNPPVKIYDGDFSKPIEFNGQLFFISNQTNNFLFKTDGSLTGANLNTSNIQISYPFLFGGNAVATPTNVRNMTIVGNDMYFIAYEANTNWGLWKLSGTDRVASAVLYNYIVGGKILDIFNPANNLGKYISFNNSVYFIAKDENNRYELWRTSTTDPAGVKKLTQVCTPGSTNCNGDVSFYNFFILNGYLYFVLPQDTDPSGHTGVTLYRIDASDNVIKIKVICDESGPTGSCGTA